MGGGEFSSASTRPTISNLTIILPVSHSDLEKHGILTSLQRNFPHVNITFHQHSPGSHLPAHLFENADVLFTLFGLPEAPLSKTAPKLKWVHFFSAGVNLANNSPVWKCEDITLTTSSGTHGPQISEWVIMTALVEQHRFRALDRLRRHKQWGRLAPESSTGKRPTDELDLENVRDMVGQRIGVLGYGSIGRQVGRVAKAMGMTVLAFTATPKNTPDSRRDTGYIVPGTGDPEGHFPEQWYSGLDKSSLHKFLGADLDFLVICMPLTKETRHSLGTPEFEILSKRHAFVSNISRGPIIKQSELVSALKETKDGPPLLRGAALDVTDPEPLPSDDPLWDLPNVMITPHISGLSGAYNDRTFEILELNLERWGKGERLVNVVNRDRGY